MFRRGAAKSCTIPRQGMRVSCLGVDVDAILSARSLEIPNQSFIIGKERALANDQLLHERCCLGSAAD